jgi:Putative 8-oxoguanine DNA glycosylase OGG-like protein
MSLATLHISDFKDLVAAMPTARHAFRAKSNKKWKPVLKRTDAAGTALKSLFGNQDEVCISRGDLRLLGNEETLDRFVLATLLWGYPDGMQGNHVADICGNLYAITGLLIAARSTPITDWNKHFQAVKTIRGVGLSTYTKWLTFLPATVHNRSALILDRVIIDVAKRGIFTEFSADFSARTYPQYLERMYTIANTMGVPAENLEFFLYEFGLSLK